MPKTILYFCSIFILSSLSICIANHEIEPANLNEMLVCPEILGCNSLTNAEDIFYQTYKWEFIDEKVIERIREESRPGLLLFLLKRLAIAPSIICSAHGINEVIDSNDSLGEKLKKGGLYSLSSILLLTLRGIVGSVGKAYNTSKVQNKVFQEIANHIDLYKKYLPEELTPLFEQLSQATEEERKEIIPRISENIVRETEEKLTAKYTFWRKVKNGVVGLCKWGAGQVIAGTEYVVALALFMLYLHAE